MCFVLVCCFLLLCLVDVLFCSGMFRFLCCDVVCVVLRAWCCGMLFVLLFVIVLRSVALCVDVLFSGACCGVLLCGGLFVLFCCVVFVVCMLSVNLSCVLCCVWLCFVLLCVI